MRDETRLGLVCTNADDIVLPDYLASLARARGSLGQLPQYAALIAGVRTALDDWVPIERLDSFEGTCRELGLYVLVDCIFEPLGEQTIISGSNDCSAGQDLGRR
jgi:hypothetical protein